MRGKLYTTNEVATILDVNPSRVRQMIMEKRIESVKLGRDNFVTEKGLKQAEVRKTKRGPEPKRKKQKS